MSLPNLGDVEKAGHKVMQKKQVTKKVTII